MIGHVCSRYAEEKELKMRHLNQELLILKAKTEMLIEFRDEELVMMENRVTFIIGPENKL